MIDTFSYWKGNLTMTLQVHWFGGLLVVWSLGLSVCHNFLEVRKFTSILFTRGTHNVQKWVPLQCTSFFSNSRKIISLCWGNECRMFASDLCTMYNLWQSLLPADDTALKVENETHFRKKLIWTIVQGRLKGGGNRGNAPWTCQGGHALDGAPVWVLLEIWAVTGMPPLVKENKKHNSKDRMKIKENLKTYAIKKAYYFFNAFFFQSFFSK